VDLVDEEDTRNDFSTSLFAPLSNLLINLLSHLRFNFTDVSCKKSQKALSSAVNNVDFMQCHSMNNLLSLLELTFRALNEASLRAYVVVVTASSE